ncbi:NAD(P)-dependent oxidoreductase [Halomonas sp. NyZ770]|uniref:NAD(P)-dependent oxidoreductase n=1 Tax=Halomonas sp. NyZ770 TaxID=2883106 RepID=UPI001D0BB449|nr:NAD(P)-dependent oxidoreductase [Halomonas sp. NyZ770]UDM08596.1 NAD(P)-dependent oxidoreductase [Halomonas sp. NyZ770]
MKRIGFIGLGLMGANIARNIMQGGYPMALFDPCQENLAPLVAHGAKSVESPQALAECSDIVFICVPGAPQVEAIVEGRQGLVLGAHDGLVIVDCSTSDPTLTRRLSETLADKGVAFMDAALGGTPTQAESGELQAIVGAEKDTLEVIRPVLECWASKILHVGPAGAGHTMKLLNQFLAMGYGAIYSEALTIGAKAGVTPAVFDSVIRGSRMDSGFYQTFFQYVLERDRNAHRFSLANAGKDISYVANLANDLNVKAGVANAIQELYASALDEGAGECFVPELSDIVARRHGVSFSP